MSGPDGLNVRLVELPAGHDPNSYCTTGATAQDFDYFAEGILKQDPFAALDQDGVGQLVKNGDRQRPKDPATLQSWRG